MDRPVTAVGRPRKDAPPKRDAILVAGRTAFLAGGYARTSVDAIASAAGVSKRTVYQHFRDKESLFTEIVLQSSTTIAKRHVSLIRRHLDTPTDIAASLTALGVEWQRPDGGYVAHNQLVRLLIAEATHFPAIIERWMETGPRPVHAVLAGRFDSLAAEGRITVATGDAAAAHYIALVMTPATNESFFRSLPLERVRIDQLVSEGVAAFLRIYPTT